MKKLFITLLLFPLSLLSMQQPPSGKHILSIDEATRTESGLPAIPFTILFRPNKTTETTQAAANLENTELGQAIIDVDDVKVGEILRHYTTSVKSLLNNPDLVKDMQGKSPEEIDSYKNHKFLTEYALNLYNNLFEEAHRKPTARTLKDIMEYRFAGLVTPELVSQLRLTPDELKEIKAIAEFRFHPEIAQQITSIIDQYSVK